TKAFPFTVWVKGRLRRDAEIGGEASIITRSGRVETGVLEAVNPQYELDYGDFIEELIKIGDDARLLLFGDEKDE
ncbi:MAG: 2-amino-4-ketopentanoate thiolase, partial [Clostridiales bacterium]|nr:2-amino-4-ketopentanoate thiolase [Clostridiales bacterium]